MASDTFAQMCSKYSCLPCDGGGDPAPRSEEIVYKRNFVGDNDDAKPTLEYADARDIVKQRARKRRRQEQDKPATEACWLCARTQGRRAPGSALGRFYKMFADQYRNLNEGVLYEQLHAMFESQVRAPLLLQNIECPELSAEEIKEHLLEHNLDPGVWVSEEIRTLKSVSGVMRNNMFTEKDGAVDVNDKRVINYLKVQKHITDLYNARLANMNYFCPQQNVAK